MIVLKFLNGKGAPQLMARTEQDDFTGELLVGSRLLEELAAATRPFPPVVGPGGGVLIGDSTVEVAPEDVVIQITFEGEARVDDSLGMQATREQLWHAATVLDETGRIYLRQAIGRQQVTGAVPPAAAVPVPDDAERERIRNMIQRKEPLQ